MSTIFFLSSRDWWPFYHRLFVGYNKVRFRPKITFVLVEYNKIRFRLLSALAILLSVGIYCRPSSVTGAILLLVVRPKLQHWALTTASHVEGPYRLGFKVLGYSILALFGNYLQIRPTPFYDSINKIFYSRIW